VNVARICVVTSALLAAPPHPAIAAEISSAHSARVLMRVDR
jgi:hypothetical protein